jgi:hypothetical protein
LGVCQRTSLQIGFGARAVADPHTRLPGKVLAHSPAAIRPGRHRLRCQGNSLQEIRIGTSIEGPASERPATTAYLAASVSSCPTYNPAQRLGGSENEGSGDLRVSAEIHLIVLKTRHAHRLAEPCPLPRIRRSAPRWADFQSAGNAEARMLWEGDGVYCARLLRGLEGAAPAVVGGERAEVCQDDGGEDAGIQVEGASQCRDIGDDAREKSGADAGRAGLA